MGISMYQKSTLPYIIPYLFTPSLFSFGAFLTDRLTDKILHPLFPRYDNSFFFPLSARVPTRRRKFTGLAELRGGWPIELGVTAQFPSQKAEVSESEREFYLIFSVFASQSVELIIGSPPPLLLVRG